MKKWYGFIDTQMIVSRVVSTLVAKNTKWIISPGRFLTEFEQKRHTDGDFPPSTQTCEGGTWY